MLIFSCLTITKILLAASQRLPWQISESSNASFTLHSLLSNFPSCHEYRGSYIIAISREQRSMRNFQLHREWTFNANGAAPWSNASMLTLCDLILSRNAKCHTVCLSRLVLESTTGCRGENPLFPYAFPRVCCSSSPCTSNCGSLLCVAEQALYNWESAGYGKRTPKPKARVETQENKILSLFYN